MHKYQDQNPSPQSFAITARPLAAVGDPDSAYERSQSFYGSAGSDNSDAGTIIEYLRILRRHKNFIALCSIISLGLGYLAGLPMKPVYRAQTLLEILSMNEDFMDMKHSSPVSQSDNSEDTSEEQTQARLLQSAALLQHVSSRLLEKDRISKDETVSSSPRWRQLLHLHTESVWEYRQAQLHKAIASMKVRPTGRTRLLEVTADSTSPQFAAEFLNTLSQEFIRQNMQARFNDTERTGEWLRREIDDARSRLKTSENALQNYAHESGLIFTDENTNVATEKLQQIQQQSLEASRDRILKQSRFEQARTSPADSLADVLNDAGLRETSAKLKDIQRQIAELSAIYNPGYRKLKELQAEQISLQSAFNHDRADILSRIQTDYQESLRREKLLSVAYQAQVREVSGQGEKGIQYNILKREVDSNRQLYDAMLQQTKQASVASAMRASNVRIVDLADRPTVPVLPNFILNSGVGFTLGLSVSILFVILRAKADRTLLDPGETQLWTNLPDLGTVPSATLYRKNLSRLDRAQVRTLASGGPRSANEISCQDIDSAPTAIGLSPRSGPSSNKPSLDWKSEPSFVAEAFRSILTSILVTGNFARSPRVLVLTSASASEGKTTVVSNLGIAMAEIGRSVLIVDADMRRPRLHNLFNVSNEKGLSDILRAKQFPEVNAAELIKSTTTPGLHLLPSGAPTNGAANLVHSPNLESLVAQLRSQYDLVLIDTPPMQMTDARVTARLADAVILVARSGQTTRDALVAAAKRLQEDRITILGTVLNDWNPKESRGDYYYGDRYYSQYKGTY